MGKYFLSTLDLPLSDFRYGGMVLIGGKHVKPAIREVLQYVIDHPEMTTRDAVDSYFDQFLWSIEKQEWNGLTDLEKQLFVDQLNLQIGISR